MVFIHRTVGYKFFLLKMFTMDQKRTLQDVCDSSKYAISINILGYPFILRKYKLPLCGLSVMWFYSGLLVFPTDQNQKFHPSINQLIKSLFMNYWPKSFAWSVMTNLGGSGEVCIRCHVMTSQERGWSNGRGRVLSASDTEMSIFTRWILTTFSTWLMGFWGKYQLRVESLHMSVLPPFFP